jgi:hypothetical protein
MSVSVSYHNAGDTQRTYERNNKLASHWYSLGFLISANLMFADIHLRQYGRGRRLYVLSSVPLIPTSSPADLSLPTIVHAQ